MHTGAQVIQTVDTVAMPTEPGFNVGGVRVFVLIKVNIHNARILAMLNQDTTAIDYL